MDHAPEPHAPHSHGHAHSHDHDHGHHHHGGSDYYLQQLLTIFICGAFGVVGLLMCFVLAGPGVTDNAGNPLTKLGVLLVPGFHPWVLGGSVLLLAVTVIRGVALWKSAGANHSHPGHDHRHHHDHKPGETCDHPSHAHDHHHHHDPKPGETCDHPSHAHGHDHHHGHHHDHDHGDHSADDHSHGNIYWRVIVMLLPVIIYLMGMPNDTFSPEYLGQRVKDNAVSGDLADVASTGSTDVSFETLATAAYSEESRNQYTGKTVTLNGQFKPLTNTQFTLFFFKMTCCSADQVPLKATCVVKDAQQLLLDVAQDPADPAKKKIAVPLKNGSKVSVTGRLQFTQDPTTQEWLTVIRVDQGGLKKR